MKKYFLLSIIFIFFSSFIFGQKKPKPLEIDLFKQSLKSVYIPFEVIDLRERTDFLGNVYTGVSNYRKEAKLKDGAEFQFKTIIEKYCTPVDAPKDSFALVIKEMRIIEDYEPDQASLNVFFEFYKVKDSLYYKMHEFDNFYFYKSPFVHKRHSEKITQMLNHAIVDFEKIVKNNLLPPDENGISKETLLLQKVNHTYDILTTTEYKQGFYRTYAEFLNNEPSLTKVKIGIQKNQYTREGLLDYDDIYISNKGEISKKDFEKKLKTMWGFSDGVNLYINNISLNNATFFSEIKSLGPYCYIISIDRSKRDMAFGLLGGATGVIISINIKSIGSKYSAPTIFKLEDQNTFGVSIGSMGLMLRDDKETVNAYKDERRRGKRSTKFKYIQIYNNKNIEKFIKKMKAKKELREAEKK